MTEEKIKSPENKNEGITCENAEPKNEINENYLKEIETLKKDLNAQNERFLRLAAEYDNYRKRSEKDKISIYSDAKSKTIFEILPIADCIERAIEASKSADNEYQKGLQMLSDQFTSSLLKLGVECFGNEGDEFCPEIHNAISHIDSEEYGENVIVQVFQKGYKLGDKIIRHAMVSVAN